ncbi:MAG: RNA-binding domain-containing protein [Candidatus Omnitrophota bacterium]
MEFKEGWNPEAVLHTMCAFANDVNNWGGGYIVIGVREKKGIPAFSPKGLSPAEIAKIQKEILSLSHKIRPEYFPIVDVTNYKGKNIVIIWVPGGVHRPYKAAVSLGKVAEYAYYIRRNDTTKRAMVSDERSLMKLANDVPFDDRVNNKATLEDLNVRLIEEYLYAIKSTLVKEIPKMSLKGLCRRMNIVEGPDEFLRLKNIGLMLFCSNPQKFFPVAQIDVVKYKDEVGDDFDEKIFTGPIHEQARAALKYIKDMVIIGYVHKVEGRAEADRFFNYPYEAIEEALVNAVYHRSYEEREPIVVRIYPDKILVISYPGPVPPLGKNNINKPIITPPRYRNRRLGDFLKELELTEGRCTGFPKIRRALKTNGSPAPIFQTDADREYFMVTLKINPRAKAMAARITPEKAEKSKEKGKEKSREKILEMMVSNPKITTQEIADAIGLSIAGIEKAIRVLKKQGQLQRIGPDKGGYWKVVK